MKKTTRELVDEHEHMLQSIRGFMKITIDLGEQQLKINERNMERLDELKRQHNVLVKIVAGLTKE